MTTATAMALLATHFLVFLLGIKVGKILERIILVQTIHHFPDKMIDIIKEAKTRKKNVS